MQYCRVPIWEYSDCRGAAGHRWDCTIYSWRLEASRSFTFIWEPLATYGCWWRKSCFFFFIANPQVSPPISTGQFYPHEHSDIPGYIQWFTKLNKQWTWKGAYRLVKWEIDEGGRKKRRWMVWVIRKYHIHAWYCQTTNLINKNSVEYC